MGHADADGSPAGNRRVASARAQAVFLELRRLGVPAGVMTVESAGSDKPIATNESSAGRASNRRVDVVVYD